MDYSGSISPERKVDIQCPYLALRRKGSPDDADISTLSISNSQRDLCNGFRYVEVRSSKGSQMIDALTSNRVNEALL